ncbi:hypothetical protein Cch01nite_35930 [Cellulomonas chitinilytica]|uniref:Uncharacterized protein n=1 Tax=Cellulomonas chitinilytica TaxID=398759 RepID=A0A919U480_9CELL|nr:hypothetical protein Cch01nite_35930 [Cellulomonas chitinilytica]
MRVGVEPRHAQDDGVRRAGRDPRDHEPLQGGDDRGGDVHAANLPPPPSMPAARPRANAGPPPSSAASGRRKALGRLRDGSGAGGVLQDFGAAAQRTPGTGVACGDRRAGPPTRPGP